MWIRIRFEGATETGVQLPSNNKDVMSGKRGAYTCRSGSNSGEFLERVSGPLFDESGGVGGRILEG